MTSWGLFSPTQQSFSRTAQDVIQPVQNCWSAPCDFDQDCQLRSSHHASVVPWDPSGRFINKWLSELIKHSCVQGLGCCRRWEITDMSFSFFLSSFFWFGSHLLKILRWERFTEVWLRRTDTTMLWFECGQEFLDFRSVSSLSVDKVVPSSHTLFLFLL